MTNNPDTKRIIEIFEELNFYPDLEHDNLPHVEDFKYHYLSPTDCSTSLAFAYHKVPEEAQRVVSKMLVLFALGTEKLPGKILQHEITFLFTLPLKYWPATIISSVLAANASDNLETFQTLSGVLTADIIRDSKEAVNILRTIYEEIPECAAKTILKHSSFMFDLIEGVDHSPLNPGDRVKAQTVNQFFNARFHTFMQQQEALRNVSGTRH